VQKRLMALKTKSAEERLGGDAGLPEGRLFEDECNDGVSVWRQSSQACIAPRHIGFL
jgi:hypothetical protein